MKKLNGYLTVEYHYYRCSKKKTPCRQSYLSSTIFESQLREIIFSVSANAFATSKFLQWGRADTQKESAEVSKNIGTLTSAILDIDSRLDTLLDVYLDKSIDQLEYQHKKNKLLNTKTQFLEQMHKLETKGTAWLEPFEEFVNCALRAHKIVRAKNNCPDLLIRAKTVGSNYFLVDKTIRPKFQNDGFLALANGAGVACATAKSFDLQKLLPRMDSNHD